MPEMDLISYNSFLMQSLSVIDPVYFFRAVLRAKCLIICDKLLFLITKYCFSLHKCVLSAHSHKVRPV